MASAVTLLATQASCSQSRFTSSRTYEGSTQNNTSEATRLVRRRYRVIRVCLHRKRVTKC